MKKTLIIIGIVVLALIGTFFIGGSIGKKEVLNLDIESVDLNEVEDGVYIGSYAHSRWNSTVKVTVSDNKITSIIRTKPSDATNQKVIDELVNQIISKQNTHVDTVSMASVNSNSFMKAVENALTGK